MKARMVTKQAGRKVIGKGKLVDKKPAPRVPSKGRARYV